MQSACMMDNFVYRYTTFSLLMSHTRGKMKNVEKSSQIQPRFYRGQCLSVCEQGKKRVELLIFPSCWKFSLQCNTAREEANFNYIFDPSSQNLDEIRQKRHNFSRNLSFTHAMNRLTLISKSLKKRSLKNSKQCLLIVQVGRILFSSYYQRILYINCLFTFISGLLQQQQKNSSNVFLPESIN